MIRLPNLREVLSKTNYYDWDQTHPMNGWRERVTDKWRTPEVDMYMHLLKRIVPDLERIVKHGKPTYDFSFDVYLDQK